MERAIVAYERGYRRVATYLVFLPLLAMTVIEFLNAIGRKLFIPFPSTVESVESLLAARREGGHVNVTITNGCRPAPARRLANVLAGRWLACRHWR
jgi:hypothetical protein